MSHSQGTWAIDPMDLEDIERGDRVSEIKIMAPGLEFTGAPKNDFVQGSRLLATIHAPEAFESETDLAGHQAQLVANARLVIAAPDLLVKAEADRREVGLIVEDMGRFLAPFDSGSSTAARVEAWKARLMTLWSDRAAIAKAKGAAQ